ncbi:MAG: hypothetical protein LBN27_01920 [Prevotellaceae bacterium]|jgi:hypothetical protein|nr:hypothetical protein [Prevotellaceae bacterium]
MQNFYYYIVLSGVCAFLINAGNLSFKGSSANAKMFLTVAAFLGFLSFAALVITSFFIITWWHSVLLFIVASAIGGLINPIGKNVFIALLAVIGIVIFNILSWTAIF